MITLLVQCSAPANGKGRVSKIATLAMSGDRWVVGRAPESKQPVTQTITDDDGSERLRWEMRCALCGLNFVARDEVMQRIASQVAAAGLPVVELGILVGGAARGSGSPKRPRRVP